VNDDLGTVTIQNEDWNDDLGRYEHCRILQADSRALISEELLTAIRGGESFIADLDGDLLTVKDSHGRQLVYRVHAEPYYPGWPAGGYLMEQVT